MDCSWLASSFIATQTNQDTTSKEDGVGACVSVILRTVPHVPLEEIQNRDFSKLEQNNSKVQILFIKRAIRLD